MQHQPITPETEQALQQSGGPLEIAGEQGRYVVMRRDVYDAMLGIADEAANWAGGNQRD